MKIPSNLLLLVSAFVARRSAAFPQAVPRALSLEDHPFAPPGPGDVRSPCPGLNTLANHGFLPRDGKGLTTHNIVQASLDGFNVQSDVVLFPAKIGLTTSTAMDTFTLQDIRLHNSIEHDSSLSRGDIFFGDNFSFNETLFQALATQNPNTTYYDAIAAGRAQRIRLAHSIEHNPQAKNTRKEFVIRVRESALYLAVMGGDLTTGTVPKTYVDVFFREERLPIAEGWTRPSTGITGRSLNAISTIIGSNSQWSANTTQEATVTFQVSEGITFTI